MQIFLDTANIDQIKQAARLGIISGVTTNPSLSLQAIQDDTQVYMLFGAIILSGMLISWISSWSGCTHSRPSAPDRAGLRVARRPTDRSPHGRRRYQERR